MNDRIIEAWAAGYSARRPGLSGDELRDRAEIWAAGYEAGRLRAVEELRERGADLDAQHLPPPARTYEDRVADRIREMEIAAIEFAARPRMYDRWYRWEPVYDPPTHAETPHLDAGLHMAPTAESSARSHQVSARTRSAHSAEPKIEPHKPLKEEASVYEFATPPNNR